MFVKKVASLLAIAAVATAMLPSVSRAADADSVTVNAQAVKGYRVVISAITASQAGWLVVHATSEGAPGIGVTYVPAGTSENVVVAVDGSAVTPELIAMLHVDDGTLGKYEFDGKNGLDLPVKVGDAIVAPKFNVIGVDVDDQFVTDTVVVDTVVAQADGWIAIHAGQEQGFAAIGAAPIKAGINKDVEVKVDAAKVTPQMSAMIHLDSGEIGKYEFDGKNGLDLPANGNADIPAALGGGITNEPFMTVENVKVSNQLATDSVVVNSVLAKVDGWIVIHSTAEGNPGIGVAAVKAGFNDGVVVKIDDPTKLTPSVLAMLHVDDGAAGKYEFDGKNGLDLPVSDAAGKVIAPLLSTTNAVSVLDQKLDDAKTNGYVVVQSVTAAADGWLVIHSTAEGNPGIGVQYVPKGTTAMLIVKVDPAKLTDTVLAMLHVDDGAAGKYEFDGKNGLDLPVSDAAGKVIAPAITLN